MKQFFKMKTKGNNNVQIVSDCNGTTTIVDNDGIRITRNGVTTIVDNSGVKSLKDIDFNKNYNLILDMIMSNNRFDSYEKKEAIEFLNEFCKNYDR